MQAGHERVDIDGDVKPAHAGRPALLTSIVFHCSGERMEISCSVAIAMIGMLPLPS